MKIKNNIYFRTVSKLKFENLDFCKNFQALTVPFFRSIPFFRQKVIIIKKIKSTSRIPVQAEITSGTPIEELLVSCLIRLIKRAINR